MNSLINKLAKIDDSYLNCNYSKLCSYLSFRNFPVASIYFKSLERTSSIFKQIFVEKKTSWAFHHQCFDNRSLQLLGITEKRSQLASFHNLLDVWSKRRYNEQVFLFVDSFWLPYRREDFQNKHRDHCVILSNIVDDTFLLIDDKSNKVGDYELHECNRYYFESGFLNSNKVVFLYESVAQTQTSNQQLNDEIYNYFHDFNDDYEVFNQILFFIEHYMEIFIQELIHFFIVYHGSRKLFSLFLRQYEYDDLALLYSDVAKEAELLKNVFIKNTMTNRFESSSYLKKLVQGFVEKERAGFDHIKKIFTP